MDISNEYIEELTIKLKREYGRGYRRIIAERANCHHNFVGQVFRKEKPDTRGIFKIALKLLQLREKEKTEFIEKLNKM
ncbi:MAG: hypothetical protein ACOCUL_01035 [Bacteroidota bacterium]